MRLQYNRQEGGTENLFAGVRNVAGDAGVLGVSTDPFDWGAPALSFSSLASLTDLTPSLRRNQTVSVGDQMIKTRGRHTVRWGGDYRDIRFDSRSDPNARGSFVFTGLYTGLDFADFLLGVPQQASVQFGAGVERFHQTSADLYLQDAWRARDTLTIDAGVRYEYVSPFDEGANHLVNLDVSPGFTAAVPVLAGGTGPYFGAYPDSIVTPDRNDVAPRIGLAWRPAASTIVRAGYGITYSTGVYQTIAQQLANQPPFARRRHDRRDTGVADRSRDGAGRRPDRRDDQLVRRRSLLPRAHVQIWNVDLQRSWCAPGTLASATRAPGVRSRPGARAEPDAVRAAHRRRRSVPVGILERRIDHARAHRPGASPARSWGRRRHQLHAVEIDRRCVVDRRGRHGGGAERPRSGGGARTLDLRSTASRHRRLHLRAAVRPGSPMAERRDWRRVAGRLGDQCRGAVRLGRAVHGAGAVERFDVSRGTNGTLRADYSGAPIALSDPNAHEFFNALAFTMPPPGAFGNAGRNTIIGPGTSNVNLGLTRNVVLGASRVLSVQLMVTNLFNTPRVLRDRHHRQLADVRRGHDGPGAAPDAARDKVEF